MEQRVARGVIGRAIPRSHARRLAAGRGAYADDLRFPRLLHAAFLLAGEMPDIVVAHVETPVAGSALGAKGIGEAGTIGAAAAVGNAINDALVPLGAELLQQPYTPQRILKALGIEDR